MSINSLFVTAEKGFNCVLKLTNTHPDTLEGGFEEEDSREAGTSRPVPTSIQKLTSCLQPE